MSSNARWNANAIDIVCKKTGSSKKPSEKVSVRRCFPAYERIDFIWIHPDTFIVNNAAENFYLIAKKIQLSFDYLSIP